MFGGKEDFKHLDFLETCKVWKVWKVNRLCKIYSRPTLDKGVVYGAKYQMYLHNISVQQWHREMVLAPNERVGICRIEQPLSYKQHIFKPYYHGNY